MKRRIIPGLMLAFIGIALFTYQAYGLSMRKNLLAAKTSAAHSHTVGTSATATEEGFPAISLLAGFLFMSGISVAAVSANLRTPQENSE